MVHPREQEEKAAEVIRDRRESSDWWSFHRIQTVRLMRRMRVGPG